MRRPTIRSRGRPTTSGRARGKAASRRVLSRTPASRARTSRAPVSRTPISGVPTSRARTRRTRNMKAASAQQRVNAFNLAQMRAQKAANGDKSGSKPAVFKQAKKLTAENIARNRTPTRFRAQDLLSKMNAEMRRRKRARSR